MTTSPKRILVVEDQRLVAADIEDTLRHLGYEVVGNVSSGEDAIDTASGVRPDLVLMDIRLAGRVDGIEAAKVIRERIDVPIVYLTAYADEETVRRAMVTGPFGYLVKPFNERELRAAIDIAVYKHATDRQLAEETARRRFAEEFRFLVEAVQDYAIYGVDTAGRITTWNVGAERITGYAASEVIGQPSSMFYTREDIDAGRPGAALKAAIERERFEEEGWRVRQDGSRFWANVVFNVMRDEHGQMRGIAEVTRDMTARRAAELELKESAARNEAMISGALDCIVSMEANGRVTEWNPAAEQTFGYSREEAVGREMAELIIPEHLRAHHRAGLDRYLRTGEGPILGKRVEMPALTKRGMEIMVELTVTVLPVGESASFTGFLRDITAKKEAEVEAKRQEAAQRLLDDATVALASSLELSETIQRAAGCAIPDLADSCLVDLLNDVGELRRVASERIAAGEELSLAADVEHVVSRVITKPEVFPSLDDSTWAGDVSYLRVPITVRGEGRGVLSLLRGAPLRRYSAKDLVVAEELARRIALAVDNARLFRAAQDAIRARDDFLSIASHELKTPLTPILIGARVLQEDAAKLATDVGRPFLEKQLRIIERQASRLHRLIADLLDVSRVAGGRLKLELAPVDITEVIHRVAADFRERSELERAKSELRLDGNGALIGQWDRTRLEQVLTNLLSNALKYGAGKPIRLRWSRRHGEAVMEVQDAGIGIAPEDHERIFDRFERVASGGHYAGLGVGLFLTRQLVESMGGSISVLSEVGRGATFRVVLPLEPRSSE